MSEHSYTNLSPSRIHKKYRSEKRCSVRGCRNRSYRYTKTSLHIFPQNELRAEWARILRIKTIPKNAYACSDHFDANDFVFSTKGAGKVRRLKKTAVPSRNIPSLETEITDLDEQNVAPIEKVEAHSVRSSRARKRKRSSFVSPTTEAASLTDENIPANVEFKNTETTPTGAKVKNDSISTDHQTECKSIENIPIYAELRGGRSISAGSIENIPTATELRSHEEISRVHQAECRSIENTLPEVEHKCNQNTSTDDGAEDGSNECAPADDQAECGRGEDISPVVQLKIDESTQTEAESTGQTTQAEAKLAKNVSPPVTMLDLMCTDEQVRELTGLESIRAFRRLCDTFKDEIRPSDCHFEAKLDDRILLTLMKLRTNCSFSCLAAFFHTTESSAATSFYRTLRTMHQCLKHLIRWPTRDEVNKNLPKCFEKLPSTRVVLDYWKFPVECGGCAECSVPGFSPEKRTHTLKAELGTSPAGLITHVSPVHSGRVPDGLILAKSGILDKLEAGDSLMTLESSSKCERRRVLFIQPRFDSNGQSTQEPEDARYIKLAGMHVQRSNQRLEAFKILKDEVSPSVVPYFDEIIGVICSITNLSHSVSPDNKP